jgi:hypothetical protein
VLTPGERAALSNGNGQNGYGPAPQDGSQWNGDHPVTAVIEVPEGGYVDPGTH